MPQKLNKAGKMQDYIPKGNGDASGEYGTSNGTNKNFTESDKKSSKANVIIENKSVVVGDNESNKRIAGYRAEALQKEIDKAKANGKDEEYIKTLETFRDRAINESKGKKTIKVRDEDVEVVDKMPDGFAVDDLLNKTSPYTPDGYLWVSDYETSSLKDRQYKLIEKDKWYNRFKEQDNKANIIDDDLSGKKERAYDGSEYKSMSKEEQKAITDKLEKAGARIDTNYKHGRQYEIYDKGTKNWNTISFSEDGKMFIATINGTVFTYDNLETAIDRATYKSGKSPYTDSIGYDEKTGGYKAEIEWAFRRKHTKYDD